MIDLAERLKNKSHVIWDWNGTLLNDIDHCVEVIGDILDDYGMARISREEYRRAFRFPVIEYYRDLGFDVDKNWKELARKFVSAYNAGIGQCSLFEGVEDLLQRLQGTPMSVLSAANQDDLHGVMKERGLRDYFDNVYGLSDHNAASKIERGRQLLEDNHVDKSQALLVGDTDHDAEVARELGVDVLLLGDGHQCHTRLRRLDVDVLQSRYGAE